MTENDEALKEAGLKVTHPRVRILELFQSDPKTHYSAEEVHNYLIKNNESIGLATIYRVLTQLETAGLLQKNNFDDSTSTYEIKKQHHDHLICIECGKIIEEGGTIKYLQMISLTLLAKNINVFLLVMLQ